MLLFVIIPSTHQESDAIQVRKYLYNTLILLFIIIVRAESVGHANC